MPTPPPPPLHPGTHEPVSPGGLAPLFPLDLILQEARQERYIPIPEPVLEAYRQYRPSPLYRARRWETLLGTPAHIYHKYEGVSSAGSHKINIAVAQVYYNAQAGIMHLTTETGAGQWGTALSCACALFGVTCEVWQVGGNCDTKTQCHTLIEAFGGKVYRSPSQMTDSIHAGRLRYHGMAPLVSHVVREGLIEAVALHQNECSEAGVEFARTQGIVAAPESSHTIAQASRGALAAKESGEE